jgi:hypothetical protein
MQMYAGLSLPGGFPAPFVAGGGVNHAPVTATAGGVPNFAAMGLAGTAATNGSFASKWPPLGHSASLQVMHTRQSENGATGQEKLKKSMSLKAKLSNIFGGGKGKDKQ